MSQEKLQTMIIHNLHNTIMQSVLGGSLHKNNTSYLLLGLHHASVNRISIVLMQITPQDERYYKVFASREWRKKGTLMNLPPTRFLF